MSDCIDCTDCVEVKPIPTCTTDITVCSDLGLTTMYNETYVYIKNNTNEHITRYVADITGGNIVVDVTDMVFHPEVKYKLWVNGDQDKPFNQELMTIDGFEVYCVEFEIFRFFDSDHISISQYNAVLEVKNRA